MDGNDDISNNWRVVLVTPVPHDQRPIWMVDLLARRWNDGDLGVAAALDHARAGVQLIADWGARAKIGTD